MTNEFKKIIEGYPGISMSDARMIFIRCAGRDAFAKRDADALALIVPPVPVKDGTREDVIAYIGFLDTMIKELKLYQMGLEQQYSKEIEPEIEAKNREEEALKDSKRTTPRTKEGIIKQALAGMNRAALIAAIQAQVAAEKK